MALTRVSGNLIASGVSLTFDAGTAALPALTTTGDTNTGIFFPAADTIAFSEGGAESMRIDSSGNLGIGTTTPTAKLELKGSNNDKLVFNADLDSNNYQNGIIFKNAGTQYAAIVSGKNGSNDSIGLTFSTGTTERARFNTTGALVFAGGTTTADGIGITFPATQSASSNANTLDDYEEGSFTFTGTGLTTSPTGTAYYTKIGNQVTVKIPNITGTSNTTACTLTGLPAALRAETAYVFWARVYNNSSTSFGMLYGAHDTAVTVYWNAATDAFTASGTKGITDNLSITYTLA